MFLTFNFNANYGKIFAQNLVVLSIACLFARSGEIQPEDVVIHVVTAHAADCQMEHLCVVHGWTVIDGELSCDKRDDSVVYGRLIVEAGRRMLH